MILTERESLSVEHQYLTGCRDNPGMTVSGIFREGIAKGRNLDFGVPVIAICNISFLLDCNGDLFRHHRRIVRYMTEVAQQQLQGVLTGQ